MTKQIAWTHSALLAAAMCAISAPALGQDVGDEIIVRGVFVPDEKRSTSEISSLLDAEDFTRTGDSDVASALRRITGISIADGKFPVARGLNERYTTATLNGVPIPSPEPLRRSAPLDIVPTRILSGSTAQKTFSPQFSGEFGGAAIDLQTVGSPNENFLVVSGSLTYDTESTFRDGLFYEGSDGDRFTFGGDVRDLPDLANQAARGTFVATTDAERAAVSSSLNHSETAVITQNEIPLTGSGSFTAGRIFVDSSDLVLGGTLYAGYGSEMQRRDAVENRTRSEAILAGDDATVETYEETRHETTLNALGTLGAEFGAGDHELLFTGYVLRSSLKRARIGDIRIRDIVNDEEPGTREFTDFVERQVWQTQLKGTHVFPSLMNLQADWNIAYGEASRDAPYERFLTRQSEDLVIDDEGTTRTFERVQFDEPSLNEINFSELDDTNFFTSTDFELPLFVANRDLTVSFGASYADTERDTQNSLFQLLASSTGDSGLETARPFIESSRVDVFLDDEFFEAGLYNYSAFRSSGFPDSSNATLEVFAAYTMAELQLTDFLRVSGGLRFEDGQQEASAVQTGTDNTPLTTEIDENYVLPAVTLTWNPLGNLQLRGGYSQTITRPQFRELVPTIFTDPTFNVDIVGNPFLQNSELTNYDFRGEYYFRNGEFVTLGFFYKEIDNPIERVFLGDEGNTTTFANIDSADLWGIEAEFEKQFDLIDWEFLPTNFFEDKTFVLGTNYTFSQSEVDAGTGNVIIPTGVGGSVAAREVVAAGFIDDGRSLVGQSDHLFNLQLGLENPDTNMKATLLLNYASDRILFGDDPAGPPAVEEDVPIDLDFVFSRDITLVGQDFGFGFSATNLLGQDFEAFRNFSSANDAVPFYAFDRGRQFTVRMSYEF
ncbi:MAG: TonB-dependent receptor [Pseudomonadota bacterium]